MLSCLILLILVDGDVNSPPGTVLQNKDELFKTFREHHAKNSAPLDNYYRRDKVPGRQAEIAIQMNGNHCKLYSKDQNGVERMTVKTPKTQFHVVSVPYDPGWKYNFQGPITPEEIKEFRDTLRTQAHMTDYSNVDWGLEGLAANPPQGEIKKVTAERTKAGVPVYRFHFTQKIRPPGAAPDSPEYTRDGTMDVDPARDWAIVAASALYSSRAGYRQDFEFDYEGKVHGRPALKRMAVKVTAPKADGTIETLVDRVTEIKLIEKPLDPEEYTLGHYVKSHAEETTSSLTYYLIGGAAVLVVAGLYAIGRLHGRNKARVSGFTSDTQSPGNPTPAQY